MSIQKGTSYGLELKGFVEFYANEMLGSVRWRYSSCKYLCHLLIVLFRRKKKNSISIHPIASLS